MDLGYRAQSSMGKGIVIIALVGALLSSSQAAHAECSRGATCLGRWRKPQAAPPTPVGQAPTAAPVQAPADTPDQAPASAPVTEPTALGPRPWYGWQLLIIDGAVLATAGTADVAQVRGDGATALGLSLGLVFNIAPPIVHAFHHRSGIAWASFGVRSTLPAAIWLSTLLIQSCRGDDGGRFASECVSSTAANASAYLGLAAASALDASLFAWENPSNHKPSRATLEWTPIVAPRTDGLTVGILGAF